MSYNLRSSGTTFNMDDMNAIKDCGELGKLDELLKPVEENLHSLNSSLNEIRTYFEDKFRRQKHVIDNLLTRVKRVEERLNYSEHLSLLYERKLDDLEQVSRKVNLKIVGIAVGSHDSPDIIMKSITDECLVNNVGLQPNDFDRCHRVGPRYKKGDNKLHQDVILKMCSWRARDALYKNRKKFSFFIMADLTSRRKELLNYARSEVESSTGDVDTDDVEETDAIGRTVDYVFRDEKTKVQNWEVFNV